ncbi:MAG: type I restriction-modification system subunit M N-terminal domain-containing protein [Nitrospirae bacterium]|nr:type I restriction-modification system subunit M N-terminal domain-containing protein [Nitrospirota bacterium]
MAKQKKNLNKKKSNGGNLGFEEKLWQAADKMRGHMDPAEYKHVVLGLIFLKYISDAFKERHTWLVGQVSEPKSEYYVKKPNEQEAVLEDRDEYTAENIFWVPKKARWHYLRNSAKQPVIGKLVDDAMVAIEKENPSLKGVLPKDYARPTLDKHTLEDDDEPFNEKMNRLTAKLQEQFAESEKLETVIKRNLKGLGFK